jgi:TatA/E family protein of Tat protein translocase
MIGTQDLLIGLALILFFFGAKRLPEIARSLGKSMQEFKKGVSGEAEEGESPRAAVGAAETTSAPRACASCKAPLDADWTHCPRCGTAAPS